MLGCNLVQPVLVPDLFKVLIRCVELIDDRSLVERLLIRLEAAVLIFLRLLARCRVRWLQWLLRPHDLLERVLAWLLLLVAASAHQIRCWLLVVRGLLLNDLIRWLAQELLLSQVVVLLPHLVTEVLRAA